MVHPSQQATLYRAITGCCCCCQQIAPPDHSFQHARFSFFSPLPPMPISQKLSNCTHIIYYSLSFSRHCRVLFCMLFLQTVDSMFFPWLFHLLQNLAKSQPSPITFFLFSLLQILKKRYTFFFKSSSFLLFYNNK